MSITNFIDNHLKSLFRRFGVFVAGHKFWFLILPILVSAGLSTGLFLIEYSSDPDQLLTPVNGEGRKEKAVAEKYFPTNYTRFDATRSIKFGHYGYVMVTGKDGESVLNPSEWNEVRAIQEQILNIKLVWEDGKVYRYEDICAKWEGKCYTNSLLSVADTFAVINKGVFREPVESYYSSLYNMSAQFSYHTGSNLTVAGLLESKEELLDRLDALEQLTNSSYQDLNMTLQLFKQGLDDIESLTIGLYDKYETHLKPTLEAMNLPAYFGGLTWMNKGLEEADFCGLFSIPAFNLDNRLCNSNNPMEFVETVMEVTGQISQKHANVMEVLLKKLRSRLRDAFKTFDIKNTTKKILEVLRDLKMKTNEVVLSLETLDRPTGNSSSMNQLVKAEAVLIGVLLNSDLYPEISAAWEIEFLNAINAMELEHTQATPLVSNSLKFEMLKSAAQVPPILSINIVCMIVFSMAVCMTRNIVHSKPWLGLAGVISTVMATFSGFGLLILCGAEFTNFNFGAIFIMVGIGLDDTFVVLNSWHHTDRKASVPERMGETLAESGVSILITSLTDALSFFTAIMAPYPYVKIFCLYSGTCIVFLFLFQITFFTACLAWSGEHEEQKRSGLTLKKVKSTDNMYNGCLCFKFGEYQVDVPNSEEKRLKKDLAEEASRVLRYILRSRSARVIVCFCFIGYIIVSIYGIMNVEVYFDKTKLINYDSSMTKFVHLEDKLFRDNAFTISVIIEGDNNYTDPNTRRRIQNLLEDLESLDNINEHLTKSWLQHFETVASAKEIFLNESNSYTGETQFVSDVYNYYKERDTSFALDVAFNKEHTRIIASRFLVQGQKIKSTSDEENMVKDIRRVCQQHNDQEFKVTAFNSYFIYTDQYISIFSQTLQCILSTGIIVVTISLLLLPDILAAVATVASIVSTLIGTVGIMSIWGIALDGITLINLVMCIGFSVDFSAHFSYHYIDIKKKTQDSDVVDQSLVSVFKPIFQAATSTILGLLGLILAPSPGFIIFFKIIFIVICLGVLHALVLLPFLLQFLVDVRSRLKRSSAPEPAVLLSVRQITEEVIIKAKIVEKGAFDNLAFDHSKL